MKSSGSLLVGTQRSPQDSLCGKQNNAYWKHVFKTGSTSSGIEIMTTKLDFIRMIGE